MADLTAKDAQAIASKLLGWFFWAAHLAIDIAALLIIGAALMPLVGIKIPMVRALSFTELAYAMGAYYLYRKAR